MKRHHIRFVRIAGGALALVGTHFIATQLLARVHLLEHLLAPGPESFGALVITGAFLILRILVLLLLPGWVAARVFLWFASGVRSSTR